MGIAELLAGHDRPDQERAAAHRLRLMLHEERRAASLEAACAITHAAKAPAWDVHVSCALRALGVAPTKEAIERIVAAPTHTQCRRILEAIYDEVVPPPLYPEGGASVPAGESSDREVEAGAPLPRVQLSRLRIATVERLVALVALLLFVLAIVWLG